MKLTAESTVFNDERIAEDISAAQAAADETAQYFWFVGEGEGFENGVHITEKPQEQFRADPETGGGNLLARSDGIALRDGLEELANFSANGVNLNQNGQPVATFNSSGVDLKQGGESVAIFGASGARIGSDADYNLDISSSGFSFQRDGDDLLEINSSNPSESAVLSSIVSKTDYVENHIDYYNYGMSGMMSIETKDADSDFPSAELMLEKNVGYGRATLIARHNSSTGAPQIVLNTSGSISRATISAKTIDLSSVRSADGDCNVRLSLETTTSSGIDHDLYTAITALGWQSDVIE